MWFESIWRNKLRKFLHSTFTKSLWIHLAIVLLQDVIYKIVFWFLYQTLTTRTVQCILDRQDMCAGSEICELTDTDFFSERCGQMCAQNTLRCNFPAHIINFGAVVGKKSYLWRWHWVQEINFCHLKSIKGDGQYVNRPKLPWVLYKNHLLLLIQGQLLGIEIK